MPGHRYPRGYMPPGARCFQAHTCKTSGDRPRFARPETPLGRLAATICHVNSPYECKSSRLLLRLPGTTSKGTLRRATCLRREGILTVGFYLPSKMLTRTGETTSSTGNGNHHGIWISQPRHTDMVKSPASL